MTDGLKADEIKCMLDGGCEPRFNFDDRAYFTQGPGELVWRTAFIRC